MIIIVIIDVINIIVPILIIIVTQSDLYSNSTETRTRKETTFK